LPRDHAAIAFVDVGIGFADRAAVVVVAVGFLRICGFYISASVKIKKRINVLGKKREHRT